MSPSDTAIQLTNVGIQRDGRWILRDVSWSIPRGACTAILGPNGSGKSTLTRIIAGHVWPTVGEVWVLGERFGEADLPALRQRIRLVQAAGPYEVDPDLATHDAVLTGFFGTLGLYETPTPFQHDEAERLLAQVRLGHVSSHSYRTLSSGERVRCLIARALAAKPDLLLLDEPTAGLDLLAREQVLATIQHMFQPPRTPPAVVLITHHVEELPPATSQILLLSDGQVAAQGPPADVLRAEVLAPVYRCPLSVDVHDGRYFIRVTPSAWDGLLER